jgi:hypothetical protein
MKTPSCSCYFLFWFHRSLINRAVRRSISNLPHHVSTKVSCCAHRDVWLHRKTDLCRSHGGHRPRHNQPVGRVVSRRRNPPSRRCITADRDPPYDLAPHGIRVNTLCPTFIETPMTKPFFESAAFNASVLSKIKLGRLGTVEDLMGAVVFLASDASALMTGSALIVDGGWTAD